MERTERFYKIDRLLRSERFVTRQKFMDELDVSRATFNRDIEYMRGRFFAPIVWDSAQNAYWLNVAADEAKRYQLPGLWFSEQEAFALLVLESLIRKIQPGVIDAHTNPLRERLEGLLDASIEDRDQLRKRIKILSMGSRTVPGDSFSMLAFAVLKRRRIRIEYQVRSRDQLTTREVSPQRLIHYRDNWYLDGWCHWRKDVRSFALDAIQSVELLGPKSKDVSDKVLDRELADSYGIYAGKADRIAVLQFSEERSRWVSREVWHPSQTAETGPDGRLTLRLPYHLDTELVMDILKYGPDVQVLEPPELRLAVAEKLRKTMELYSPTA